MRTFLTYQLSYPLPLRPFPEVELREMLQQAPEAGLTLDDYSIRSFEQQTGGHPYLSAILAEKMIDLWLKEGRTDQDKALDRANGVFLDYYNRLTHLLREDNSLDKLLKLVRTPEDSSSRNGSQLLLSYGLVREVSDGCYAPFFATFRNLLGAVVSLTHLRLTHHRVTRRRPLNRNGTNSIKI